MPWFIPWSDVIKKKVCRYLLQRYLGQFLDEKLSLEQLNVDLYNGTGTVSNIALYSKVIIIIYDISTSDAIPQVWWLVSVSI